MVCENALAKVVFNNVGILIVVKCIVCSKISRKEKFVLQWDSLEKHVNKRKTKDKQTILV
jgi:hypothetical protein